MTSRVLDEGSIVLRLEFSIADAVHQRGLLPVLRVALAAWIQRPARPSRVPDYLREDLGLPPAARDAFTYLPDINLPPALLFGLRR